MSYMLKILTPETYRFLCTDTHTHTHIYAKTPAYIDTCTQIHTSALADIHMLVLTLLLQFCF